MPSASTPSSTPSRTDGRVRLAIAAVSLIGLFGAVYLPALGHGFVKDDYRWIAAADVRSRADVARFFTTNVGFYRPLVTSSFAIDRAVWGLDARGYALTNTTLLLAAAGLLFLLARMLALPPPAALLACAVWLFNFHGINMALLWMSGRTALLLCVFAVGSTLAFAGGRRSGWIASGVLALAAMLCKEEAVLLPPLFVVLYLLVTSGSQSLRAALIATLPAWVAAAVYLLAREQSGAFTVASAPDYYRLTFDPFAVLRNIGEYLDRGATLAAVVSIVMWLVAARATSFDDRERVAIRFGIAWFVAMYAITIFVPVRSSLYAVAPSIGAALVAGAFASRAWRSAPRRFSRAAVALVAVVALLVPVYRSRNHGLVEPADLAAQSLATIQDAVRQRPGVSDIILIDDPNAPVRLDAAFGALLPDALHLFVGPQWRGIITEQQSEDANRTGALVFALRNGRLVQSRISGTPAESSASHSG